MAKVDQPVSDLDPDLTNSRLIIALVEGPHLPLRHPLHLQLINHLTEELEEEDLIRAAMDILILQVAEM